MNEKIEKAKYSSDPEEQYQVGLMFRDGIDVEQDYKEAKDWFRKAAYRNHAASQFNLGVISAGQLDGGFSSKYEAKSWLEKALKQDYPGAKQLLDMIEADQELPDATILFALDKSTEVLSADLESPIASTDELAPPTTPEPEAIVSADKPALPADPEPEVPISTTDKPSPPPAPEPIIKEVAVEQQGKPPMVVEEKKTAEASPEISRPSEIKPLYDKDLLGAVTEYQPVDLVEYDGEPWDIRISMDYAPLQDAFYFTVNDPDASNESVQTVLEKYALNTDRRGELDSDEYPQLPHIQEELLGYYNSAISGKGQLSVFVNKRPSEAPIQLHDKASDHLSTCVFNDGSHDYRLLDLVFVIESKPLDASDLSPLREAHGPSFLLFLIDYLKRNSPANSGNDLSASAPFSAYMTGEEGANNRFPQVTRALKLAGEMGYITDEGGLSITQEGYAYLKSLKHEVSNLRQRYECYQSVSTNPPALGVPDGFDARIQIMRKQSVDVVRAIFLFACVFDKDALFGAQNWADDFESGESFSAIMDAFQYESDFADDILDSLMSL